MFQANVSQQEMQMIVMCACVYSVSSAQTHINSAHLEFRCRSLNRDEAHRLHDLSFGFNTFLPIDRSNMIFMHVKTFQSQHWSRLRNELPGLDRKCAPSYNRAATFQ